MLPISSFGIVNHDVTLMAARKRRQMEVAQEVVFWRRWDVEYMVSWDNEERQGRAGDESGEGDQGACGGLAMRRVGFDGGATGMLCL